VLVGTAYIPEAPVTRDTEGGAVACCLRGTRGTAMEFVADPWCKLCDLDTLEWGLVPVRVVWGTIFLDSGLGKWRLGIFRTGE